MKNSKYLLLLLAISLTLSACFKTVSNIGYTFDQDSIETIEEGKTRKAIVLRKLGSPSTKSIFGPETWYYISTQRESVAFFDPKIISQTVVAIEFGTSQVVQDIRNYTAYDARKISLSSDITKTEGHDIGVIEQLLGNVGRFNTR